MSKPRSLALPPRTRARRLVTARGDFAVLDATPEGERRGTVLLLPGYTGSKEDFLALLGPLSEAGYRAVAVDGRGQHETPGPRGRAAYRRRALALDVVAQAAALGDGPVHLLGHSFGGLVARAAATLAPRGVPLAHPALLGPRPGRATAADPGPGPAGLAGAAAEGAGLAGHALAGQPGRGTGRGRRAGDRGLPAAALDADPVAQLAGAGRLLLKDPDGTPELLGLRMPLHFAYGADEMVWPPAELAAAAARVGAHHTVVEGAGHSPNVSHPRELTARLTGFWERVAARTEAGAVAP
ncbi:alpha/beta fold hydrolase [Streptomyces narbonensis]